MESRDVMCPVTWRVEDDESLPPITENASPFTRPAAVGRRGSIPGGLEMRSQDDLSETSHDSDLLDPGSFHVEQSYTPTRLRIPRHVHRTLGKHWRKRLRLAGPGNSLPTIEEASDDDDDQFRSRAYSDSLAMFVRRPVLSYDEKPDRSNILKSNENKQPRKLLGRTQRPKAALRKVGEKTERSITGSQRGSRDTLKSDRAESEVQAVHLFSTEDTDSEHFDYRGRSNSEVGPHHRRHPVESRPRAAHSLEDLLADAEQRIEKYKRLEGSDQKLADKPPRPPLTHRRKSDKRPSWLDDIPRSSPIPRRPHRNTSVS